MGRASILAACATVPLMGMGCSGIVAGSGKDLGTLATRAEVRECFGPPLVSGTTSDGLEFDEFRTHRKLAQKWKGTGISMAFVMTLGLSELYSLPRELAIAGRETIVGTPLHFDYNADGTVRTKFGFPW